MRSSTFILPLLIAVASAAAHASSSDALVSFVAHPTHCAALQGGDDQENDGVSPEFSQAVVDALATTESIDALSVECARRVGSGE
jgi:hypothetical protein